MIEKLTNYLLTEQFRTRTLNPPSRPGVSSPFNSLLHQEMETLDPLETMAFNYLIKTIEFILAQKDQTDQPASFYGIPLGREDLFQSLPVYKNPDPQGPPDISASKSKGQEIDEIIQGAAEQYGVESTLIKAVIAVESNGNPRAVSAAGAQGLMQLMPKTAVELGVVNPFDPVQNVQAGTRYLGRLLDRYQGNRKLALAAYNWGIGNLEKNPTGLPKETRDYIVRVEKQYQSYQNSSSTA